MDRKPAFHTYADGGVLILIFSPKPERDAFDTLFDHAPDKLSVVKKVKSTFPALFSALHYFCAFGKTFRNVQQITEEESKAVKRVFIPEGHWFKAR